MRDMTAKEFELRVGLPPKQDDLDRVNCEKVGTPGHVQCGWCWTHNRPRFECGCLLFAIDMEKRG